MKRANIKYYLIAYLLLTITGTMSVVLYRPQNNSSEYVRQWFWVNKTYPYKNFNMVIYGDSRVYRGINPQKFREVFPSMDVINLGYSSGGINKEMLEFAYSKLSSKDKKIIVLGITPFSLTEKARENKHFHQEYYRPKGEVWERKFIYPFLTAFEPFDINPFSKKNNYVQKYHPSGWVESYKIQADTLFALPSYRKQLSETVISSTSIEELRNFITEKSKKGDLIFGFRPPTPKSMETLEDNLTGMTKEKMKEIFDKSGGVWLSIPNRNKYLSYDGSHLHFNAANKLSLFLAKQIKSYLKQHSTH